MNVLVTAASKYGSTEQIAQAIARVLMEHGITATVNEPEEVRAVEGFDAVILGSAVYAGHWMKSAKELVGRSAAALRTRPVWLFSSGPVGDPPKPEEDPVDVTEIFEASNARSHRVFAGKIDKRRLSFPERAIVSALRVAEGDFRDWDEIERWASEIVDAMRFEPVSPGDDVAT
jgi:menaquinone-dependent protoporphyrinogen oxidase